MCVGCRGFYDAKCIFKHMKSYERTVSEISNAIKMCELSDVVLVLTSISRITFLIDSEKMKLEKFIDQN